MGSQELFIVAAAFIFMIFLNRMLAVPQQIRLNKELIRLKKRGPVNSVAVEKSITGTRIAVLIADKDGRILEAYHVQGRSIVSGYKLDKHFPYSDCYEAKRALEGKKKATTQERAYLTAANYLVDGLSKDSACSPE